MGLAIGINRFLAQDREELLAQSLNNVEDRKDAISVPWKLSIAIVQHSLNLHSRSE